MRAPCTLSMSTIARPMPLAPAVTRTRRPGFIPLTIGTPTGVAIRASCLTLPFAKSDDRAEHDHAEEDRTHGVGKRGSSEERLQTRQQEDAARHSDIASSAARDESAADDHYGN